MTSLFHKFKKAVAGHQEDATSSGPLCPEYDLTKVDFEGLHDAMIRLRQQLLTYRESNGRLWLSSAALSTDFAQQLEMDQSHPYTAMASTFKSSHSQLPTERERLDTMLTACLAPLKDQLARMDELRERMVQHDKLKDEVVYYQGKVDSLKKTREANKKAESAADKEKYERNVKKLQDQEAAFRSADAQLVAELRHIYAHRVAVLGPIMLAFVVAEKQVVASYSAAISQVQLVDVNEANAWLAKHEQEFAASRQLDVQKTTTVAVTDLQSPRAPVVVTTTTEHQRVSSSAAAPDLLSPAAMTAVSGVTPITTSGVTISQPIVTGNPALREHYRADYGATSPTAASGAMTPFSPTASDWMSNLPPPTSSTASGVSDSSAAAAATSSYPDAFDSTPYTMGSTASYSASSASHSNGTADSSADVTSSVSSSSSSSSSSSAPSPLVDMGLASPGGHGLMDADGNSKEADAAAPAASKDATLDGFDKPAAAVNPPTLI